MAHKNSIERPGKSLLKICLVRKRRYLQVHEMVCEGGWYGTKPTTIMQPVSITISHHHVLVPGCLQEKFQ